MGNESNSFNIFKDTLEIRSDKNKQFTILKDDRIFRVIMYKKINSLLIRCLNYQIILNINDLETILKIKFNSINESYNFFINIFNSNKVRIGDSFQKNLILILTIFDDILKKDKNVEIILKQKDGNWLYQKNPIKIKFLSDISKISYNCYSVDNTFSIFKAINNLTYLIYESENVSIMCYNLNNEQLIAEINNAHDQEYITNFSYCNYNKKDIIMSVSGDNNNIKLWNFSNWECILNLKNINKTGFLEFSCFLNVKNEYLIVTSNWNYEDAEYIKVYDLQGNKIKEILNSNEKTHYLNTFYEEELSTYYIIAGNTNYIKSYNYSKNTLYKKYFENDNGPHLKAIIFHHLDTTELIESCVDGFIRIWNFHSNKLLKKICAFNNNAKGVFGFCLWNENYLFAGCYNDINLIDLIKKTVIKTFEGHKKLITCIKKVIHPKYGECLISQGYKNDQLKLWVI